ncbi:MAG: FimB/Mfa2 family fimbrial subunit [Tannerellaceae bacterium]|nr:FimB/Mfa2 family fimbrial subunit [Tannerellaceae bacterium]
MKQSILILLAILVLTSCIRDKVEDCPAAGYMVFTFHHEANEENYDEAIGNDVHLRIYRNNKLHSAGIIPYSQIKDGKEYRIKKEVTGEIDVVAWAALANEDFVAEIPAPSEDEMITGELLTMSPITRATVYSSIGQLYLGTFTHEEEDLTAETAFPVNMNDCIAQFTATIHNVPEYYEPGQTETVWLEIEGTKSQMDIRFTPKGEDAIVMVEFTEIENNEILKTSKHGLLPSAQDQYLAVRVYRGDELQGTIYTEIQSRPGDRIHLDISRTTIQITVNDWRVFETPGLSI